MSDLVAFLNARLDEDEAAAKTWASRPLREVEAKRKVLRRCAFHMNEPDAYPNDLISPRGVLARQTIAALAAVYSDHPDYRQEWKP